MKLYNKTATEIRTLLAKKVVSAVEVAEDTLAHIAATEPQVDAFLTVSREGALAAAARADACIAAGTAGPLAGLPVGVKDNICTRDAATTCASRMLENFVPPYDATVVQRLDSAGAVRVGKLNMDEFAMGSSCENSYFKPTRNPWDTERVPGGSSGGSAAAVAACQVPLALGSDTGGSIRMPAAFCGVVGLKPAYGAVSRYGLIAFASSLDQIGPLARTVDDCALLYGAICGQDSAHDATSKDPAWDAASLSAPVKGLRVGVPREYFGPGITPGVKAAVETALKRYEDLGAELVDISLPSTEYALSAYYIISSAEASSNLARYDGVKYGFSAGREGGLEAMYEATRSQGFGSEVKRRIMLGTHVLSSGYYDAYYKRAKLLQRRISAEFAAAFESCDLIATPTAPVTAFKLGEKVADPLQMYASDVCTVPVNIAGLPAASLPCGFDAGLPVGLQLIGPHFSEGRILAAAKHYETAVGGFAVKGVTA